MKVRLKEILTGVSSLSTTPLAQEAAQEDACCTLLQLSCSGP
jgi:hypothetical protein